MFIRTCVLLIALFLTLFLVDITYTHRKFKAEMIVLLVGAGFSIAAILVAWKGLMYMCYYRFTTVATLILTGLLLVYCFFTESYAYLLICLIGAVITQPLNIIFPLLVVQCVLIVVCGVVSS